jgi:hypothetical protein
MADEALFQNPLLFGRDLDPNLVSVEFDGVATVWMYQRQPDGSTRVSQEAFEPYLWSEHPVAGSTPLQGGALLGYLTTRATILSNSS